MPMRTIARKHFESIFVSSDRKNRFGKWMLPIAFCAGLAFATTSASAQSNPRFVSLGGGAVGAVYTPDSGPAPHVAFISVHRTGNNMSAVPTAELSKRGFMVLGIATRFVNNEASVNWEDIALDVRAAVRYLRAQPGITKVIIIGHSGGGPTSSFYQAVAENGPAYCQGSNKLVECEPNRLAGFVPTDKADGIIFMDAHPGNPVNRLRSLNPAYDKFGDKGHADRNLDPFSVRNGYNPNGNSVYSSSFQRKYFKEQSDRMNYLIKEALELRGKMESGRHEPSDDESFVVYHGDARLADLTTGTQRGTLSPQKLLKDNGSVQTTIINTVRVPNLELAEDDETFSAGALDLTITSFLSANAIKSTNSLDGIDWCSSNNSTICAVRNIRLPILV